VAVAVRDDADFEALVFALRSAGYVAVATVEHFIIAAGMSKGGRPPARAASLLAAN
jgi:hypothetical protein